MRFFALSGSGPGRWIGSSGHCGKGCRRTGRNVDVGVGGQRRSLRVDLRPARAARPRRELLPYRADPASGCNAGGQHHAGTGCRRTHRSAGERRRHRSVRCIRGDPHVHGARDLRDQFARRHGDVPGGDLAVPRTGRCTIVNVASGATLSPTPLVAACRRATPPSGTSPHRWRTSSTLRACGSSWSNPAMGLRRASAPTEPCCVATVLGKHLRRRQFRQDRVAGCRTDGKAGTVRIRPAGCRREKVDVDRCRELHSGWNSDAAGHLGSRYPCRRVARCEWRKRSRCSRNVQALRNSDVQDRVRTRRRWARPSVSCPRRIRTRPGLTTESAATATERRWETGSAGARAPRCRPRRSRG